MEITFNGITFSKKLSEILLQSFAEALSYSSLSCENAFDEYEKLAQELNCLLNQEAMKKYYSFSSGNQKLILEKLHFFLVYTAHYQGEIPGSIPSIDNKELIEKEYLTYLKDFDNYLLQVICFDNNEFDEKSTYKNVIALYKVFKSFKIAQTQAFTIKENHIKAFFFAMENNSLNIENIKKINEYINENLDQEESGFKKANNIIQGANFQTTSKEYVSTELLSLIYQYNHNFDTPLFTEKDTSFMSKEEKENYFLQVCIREAKFHIQFERIHPFADGNGRTGRIILCQNLIRQGFAPILITDNMATE